MNSLAVFPCALCGSSLFHLSSIRSAVFIFPSFSARKKKTAQQANRPLRRPVT
jgi:hypothetical protein